MLIEFRILMNSWYTCVNKITKSSSINDFT